MCVCVCVSYRTSMNYLRPFSFLFLPFCLSLEIYVAFFEYFCTITVFSLYCMESTSYVFPFRMVFLLPYDHGLDI